MGKGSGYVPEKVWRAGCRGRNNPGSVWSVDLKEAAGPCWLPYDILYEKDQSATNKYWERTYDLDDFETYEEYKAYVDRNEWGKKMGG